MLYLLLACSDYNLEGDKDRDAAFDTGETVPVDTDTDDTTPTDTDTTPGTCDLAVPSAGTVAILEACEGAIATEITDPWNVQIEWEYDTGGLGVIVMPAIGNLTDDDGNGRVDENDDPDVAFTEWSGYLTAVTGDGGTELFRLSGYNGNAGVTVADVTGDGEPEVIALDSRGRVNAVDASGTVVWSSAVISGIAYYPQPTVADLDNDGDAEVIFDIAVLDGATGATQATLNRSLTTSWRTPVVADLDMDGEREILLGNVTYAPNGTVLWTNSGTGSGNFAAVANIDADPEGEAMFVSGSQLLIYDSDGTRIRVVNIAGSNAGPPSVADFDGDGEVEIAIPANTTISLYEMDGTRVWNSSMQDGSGLAGCSGFDVNGDGAYEVLFADEVALRLYDGKTGAILYEFADHDSQTLWEYPVVADIDNDGSAEIAIASNLYYGGRLGITVFGHAGDGWPASGPTWGTHDFAVTNLGADGSVPTGETPSWLVHNVFRARPSVDAPGAADLFVDPLEVCVSGCDPDDEVAFTWKVGNQGPVASEPTTLELSVRIGSSETLLQSVPIPALDGGATTTGLYEGVASSFAGASAVNFRLVGVTHLECDETNQDVALDNTFCP